MKDINKGVYIALITPFNEDESIDFKSLDKLINLMNKNKVDGLFVNGTTAEFPHLFFDERIELVKFIVKRFSGSIIVNVSDSSTEKVLKNINCLKEIDGISAVSTLIPYLYKISQDQILNFYRMISRNSYFPVFVYNNPAITNGNIEVDSMKEILKFENIAGIKDSSKNGPWYESIKPFIKEKIYLSGGDGEIINYLINGSKGTISTIGNIIPGTVKKIYDSFKDNSIEMSERYQEDTKEIRKISKNFTNVSGIKAMLECFGITKRYMRFPLTSVSDNEIQQIKNEIQKEGIKKIINLNL